MTTSELFISILDKIKLPEKSFSKVATPIWALVCRNSHLAGKIVCFVTNRCDPEVQRLRNVIVGLSVDVPWLCLEWTELQLLHWIAVRCGKCNKSMWIWKSSLLSILLIRMEDSVLIKMCVLLILRCEISGRLWGRSVKLLCAMKAE